MNKIQLCKLAEKAKSLHQECILSARATVQKMIELGQYLSQVRASMPQGIWLEWLATTAISTPTAYRYIKVAEAYDAKQHLLSQGREVVDLLREPEFALVKELEGGGYRSEYYQRRQLLAAQGLQLYFEFNSVVPQFSALVKSREALLAGALPPKKLDELESRLEESLAVIKEAKSRITDVVPDPSANESKTEPEPLATSSNFVIRRDFNQSYLTPGLGWTKDPAKAKFFPTATDAKIYLTSTEWGEEGHTVIELPQTS